MPGLNLKAVVRVSVFFLALGAGIFATTAFSVGLASIRLASLPNPVAEIMVRSLTQPDLSAAAPVREASSAQRS